MIAHTAKFQQILKHQRQQEWWSCCFKANT